MHEVAICLSLIHETEQLADKYRASKIIQISISIGDMTCIDASQLARAFRVVSVGTVAQGAALKIDNVPVLVWCNDCIHASQAKLSALKCGICGSRQVDLLSGDELTITEVEIE